MEDPIFEQMVDAIMRADSETLEELLHLDKNLEERLTTFVQNGDFHGQTLLHIAADKSRNKCVRVILAQVNSELRKHLCNLAEDNEFGRIPLHTVLDGGCRCEECSAKNVDTVEVLMEEGSFVDSRDHEGDTPLFYAVEHMMADCASILLEYGADASIQLVPWKDRYSKKGNSEKVILYKYIAQKIPAALTALLDKGITASEDDSAYLNLDFKVFLPTQEKEVAGETKSVYVSERETDIVASMSEAHSVGREILLTHPMTLAFLHFKWILVRRFVIFIQLSYFIMTAAYTLFVSYAFDYILPDRDDDNSAQESETTTTFEDSQRLLLAGGQDGDDSRKNRTLINISAYFVCIWWLFMVLNELYEISLGLKMYLKVGLNYAWWLLIICVGIAIPPGFGQDPQLWQLPFAAFAVFLAWSLTLVQTSRFPSLGIYIEMLGKVVTDFAIFLVTFAAILIGFALAFHVLFPEDVMFSNVATAFVKVILIMIGETDYEETFEEIIDPEKGIIGLEYTIPAHIMFVGFIFVITIVLMNLLLGLAVSDIQELRKVATVLRVKRQIEQIQLFETLLLGKYLPKSFSNWGMKYFSIMSNLDYYDLKSRTSLLICPTDPEEKKLPKYLKEIFISHVLEKPCINTTKDLMKDESGSPENSGQVRTVKLDRGKRLRNLEEKMNQMQETLLAIQEQISLLGSK